MRPEPDTDLGVYFIVGALIAVISIVVVILSGGSPFYGNRHEDMGAGTPRAELAQPAPQAVAFARAA